MKPYQRSFIEFALAQQALRFGSYTLKSGRVSPYFFNTGVISSGQSVAMLGEFYAQTILASGVAFDMLFGPAYKGIPLGTAVAIALAGNHGKDVPFCFNRKEAKDHGEGGMTLGAPLSGRVLILDDVISAGTSVDESVAIIEAAGAAAVGFVISLDRQEQGAGGFSAVREVERRHGIRGCSIVALGHILEYLRESPDQRAHVEAILRYRDAYGVR